VFEETDDSLSFNSYFYFIHLIIFFIMGPKNAIKDITKLTHIKQI